jgi:hypothetical protein
MVTTASLVLPTTLPVVAFAAPPAPAHPTAGQAAPPSAAKKSSIHDELTGDARDSWDRGLELFSRQRWDSAGAEFQRAYDLSRNPRVLFNVGACEKALSHYTKAIEIFKRELAEGAGKLTPEDETRLRDNISGLSDFVSTLVVEVNEPDATIIVDDETVGKSPMQKPVDVNIGRRKIVVQKPGYTQAGDTITVLGKTPAKLSLKIEPIIKTSLIEVNVQGAPSAIIKVDGKEVGTSPYKGRLTVSSDPHVITAEAPGFVPVSQPVTLKEGEPTTLTLALSREIAQGRMKIRAQPSGAIIELDGKFVGADVWEGPVGTQSTHQVTVKKEGFYTWTHDIEVKPGQEKPVSVELNEDRHPSWVPWVVGTILVVGAGTVATYFIFAPKDQEPVRGTLPPYTVQTPAAFHFH